MLNKVINVLSNKQITKILAWHDHIEHIVWQHEIAPSVDYRDWLQSDGNAYINTGYRATELTGIKVLWSSDTIQSSGAIFGSFNTISPKLNDRFQVVFAGGDKTYVGYGTGNVVLQSSKYCDSKIHQLEINPLTKQVIADGEVVGENIVAGDLSKRQSQELCLFTTNQGAIRLKSTIQIHDVIITENGVDAMHLKPCVKDGESGMYDTFSETYFLNAGTGSFASGNFKPLEYLETDGHQYIDTGVSGTSDNLAYAIDMQLNMPQIYGYPILYGSRDNSGGNNRFYIAINSSGSWMYVGDGNLEHSYAPSEINLDFTQRNTFSYNLNNDKNLYFNDKKITHLDNSFDVFPMYLMTCNFEGRTEKPISRCVVGELHSCQIKKDNVLVRDLKPYLDGFNNPCMIDELTGVAYYNKGTGEFTYKEIKPLFTITGTSENGTIQGLGTYVQGTSVTLTAIPNEGYEFVQWEDGSTNPSRTIIVESDMNVVATFTPKPTIDYREWLQTQIDGAYINTGYIPTDKTTIIVEWSATEIETAGALFGSEANDYKQFSMLFHWSKSLGFGYGSTYDTSSVTNQYNDGKKHIVELNGLTNQVKIDGVVVIDNMNDGNLATEGNLPIYLLAYNTGNIKPATTRAKIHDAKICENGELVRHYRPAVREDGEPCMYEEFGKEYFANARDFGSFAISDK